jgi:hydroxymethylbilane synthase
MSSSAKFTVRVGARCSRLSRAQVEEVFFAFKEFHPDVQFEPVWIETTGDRDLCSSLRKLEKTDFFTKEIDERQLQADFRISIHSAKDLAEPLALGLRIAALTKGVDSSDVIVLTRDELPLHARIGTSSQRREENVKALRSDLICVDIRGTIEKRLEQLDANLYDGVVMAEAALIRLQLTDRRRIVLPGEGAVLQGQLAVVVREEDEEMVGLFSCLDVRKR